jgi:ubiquinone/menaquinone biosynthesis C-methylase UbiE
MTRSRRQQDTEKHSNADVAFHAERSSTYDQDITAEFGIYDAMTLIPYLDRVTAAGRSRTVLDLGCGTGAVTMRLAERGLTVHAVDHSPDMIDVARGKAERGGVLERVTFHVAEIDRLPFEDAYFDGVTCQRVLHHVPDIAPVFAEVRRVLKPGGFLYLSDGLGEETLAARVLRRVWKRVLEKRGYKLEQSESLAELEIWRPARELTLLLDANDMTYEARFFTHVGLVHQLSPRWRMLLIQALSFPWRKRKGDLIFVYATKPCGP